MQRVSTFLLLFLLPATALADGKFFPPTALPVNVTIPDQRALIQFTNGTERLVIETRFTGEGTNFAWVVPLPAQPAIEEATTGLFPTLQFLFRPQIIHNVPRYYLGILFVILIGYLIRLMAKSVTPVWHAFVIAVVFLILAGLLLPALSSARTKGMSSTTSGQAVSVLERKLVGIFETATIASRDPKALQTWLRDNGFVVPTNSARAIESYVKDGWVFVTAKVRRDDAKSDTSTPHPLSFTFKTDKPVYPMRLTGVDNGPLRVELYVFGRERAEAKYFEVERCTRPAYPEPPRDNDGSWLRWSPETPNIVHPLMRKWVGGSPAATKLTARLTPAQMREDVWLRWSAFREKKNHLYSHAGALTRALNWGAGLLAIGLFGACAFNSFKPKKQIPSHWPARSVGVVLFLSALVAGGVYLALPKMEVRLMKSPYSAAESALFELTEWLPVTNAVTRAELSAEAQRVITHPNDDASWVQIAKRYGGRGWDNFLLGGDIREEDSPGNFTLRENGYALEFVAYDAQGAPHVMPWTWTLRRER